MNEADGNMSDKVLSHPHRDLMAEAAREREVVNSPEALALREALFQAFFGYSEFLNHHGLIWDDSFDFPRLKAQALVVCEDYGLANGIEIAPKGGACDRVYGNGMNPDPYERGPADIPHKRRDDET